MKTINMKVVFAVAISFLLLSACTKEYFLDSGVHQPVYNGSNMQYLESRPELFDSLVQIVKIAGLENEVNKANTTFFVPPNVSIRKSIRNLNSYLYRQGLDTVVDLAQVDSAVWKKYLSRYILKDKYVLKDFPQIDTNNRQVYPGQGYITYNGEAMNIGVNYNDVASKNSAGVEQIIKYAGYRQLFISYGFINSPVATSDLQTNNGVLHVLNFQLHSFGFDSYEFVTAAYNVGIKPL